MKDEKETSELDIEQIIRFYDKGTLTVKDITTSSEKAEELSRYWMDFSDKEKYSQLKFAIEQDSHFDKLRIYFNEKYSGKKFVIKEKDLEVREIFKGLSDLEKFIGIAYIGLEHGLAYTDKSAVRIGGYDASFISSPQKYIEEFEKLGEKDIVEFIKQVEAIPDRKEKGRKSWEDVVEVAAKFKDKFSASYDMHTYGSGFSAHQDGSWHVDLYKPEWEDTLLAIDLIEKDEKCEGELIYRISTWHQGSNYWKIRDTFSLGHLQRSWDEETAVDDALGTDWDLQWRGMADEYLSQKGATGIKKHKEDVVKFKELCAQAEVLKSLEDSIKCDDTKLKQYLGTDSLFKSYTKIEPIAKELLKGQVHKTDNYLFVLQSKSGVEGDYFYFPPNVEHYNDPDSVKSLVFSNLNRSENAESTYYSRFVTVKDGKIVTHTFEPYYRSTDSEFRHPVSSEQNRVVSIDSIVETDKGLLVKFTDGLQQKKEYVIKL